MDLAFLVYIFSAGMFATVNPCGFAMLPAYLALYVAGEKDISTSVLTRLGRAIGVALAVAAGFLLLFLVAGLLITAGGRFIVQAIPFVGRLLGLGLVLLGIWLLLGRYLPVPSLPTPEARAEHTVRHMFLFGVAYGLASLSCTLPIFLIVVGGALSAATFFQGMLAFLVYGSGMAFVLILLTVGITFFENMLVRRVRHLLPYTQRIAALIVLGAGLYLTYYWWFAGGRMVAF